MDNLEKPRFTGPHAEAGQYALEMIGAHLLHLTCLESAGLRTPVDLDKEEPLTIPLAEDDILAKSKAHQLIDEYNQLDYSDQEEFFERFGNQCSGDAVFRMSGYLSREQLKKFSDRIFESHSINLIPHFIEQALQVVEEMPGAGKEEKLKEILKRGSEATRRMQESVAKLEQEKLATKRNRKSDPETVKRNVEICNLRIQGMSQGQLAKKFDITDAMIRKIEKEELKWRRLASIEPTS